MSKNGLELWEEELDKKVQPRGGLRDPLGQMLAMSFQELQGSLE